MSTEELGRDPLDDQLRSELRAAAPRASGDADAALRALTPRFRRARRHRQTVVGATVAAAVAVVAVAVLASLGTADGPGRRVDVPPASGTPSTTSASSPAAEPQPTPSTSEPDVTPGTASDQPSGTDTSTATGTSTGAASESTSGTPPATAASPAPADHTYPSDGGTVTVRFASGALSIVSTTPAHGYTEERHDTGPNRVEVRFRNADGEWRIRVDVVDGALSEETTRH